MLSYQHGYHAGNFADVIKHITLTGLLNYLISKDKPLLYLETHAGRGLYDLRDKHALKTGEAAQGIALLWEKRKQLPKVFSSYIQQISDLNESKESKALRYYPGSPWFAVNTLRSCDRIVCAELHPAEFDALQKLSGHGKRVFFRHSDGLAELKALLPPVERRGLIFIDPSYEVKTEYRQIPAAVKAAYQRFATGVYCIWYPIIDKHYHEQLLRGLKNVGAVNNLRIEFKLAAEGLGGMNGCGLWVINPPYVLQAELKTVLAVLKGLFNPGVSSYCILS
ncbi:MAG: 23S rRNA (adenine(2030)-N(6))-methyltransferase RlmJ [Legionellales bacterium RIFCSPHIGHO2_12_FULL_42_9]|nr:MAG: 23S rRNA (adenine(2030)-N(6))-methyltransferase RlmJ [Legionellales bacterium RIFCSPHIGHO2_12_FULL_42_9]